MQTMQKRTSKVLMVWIILSLLTVPTSSPVAAHLRAQTIEVGQISGVITDVAGQPIPDVWVEVFRGVIEGVGPWQQIGYGTTTDPNGFYLLRDLAPGIYRIRFNKSEYYLQCYEGAATVENGTNITVVAGVTTTNINAVLIHKGSIHGHVTDSRGVPLARVNVNAYVDAEGNGVWQQALHNYTVTDRDGHYAIEWLERGVYRVLFEPDSPYQSEEYYNDAATIEAATDIFVDTSAIVDDIDVIIAGPAGRIQGTVRDEVNQQLEHVGVSVQSYNEQEGYWEYVGFDWSASDGSYSVGGLQNGAYRVQFSDTIPVGKYVCPYPRHLEQYYDHVDSASAATAVVITEEATASQIDAHLLLPSHIQGRVTDLDNNPISLYVTAFDKSNPDRMLCSSTYPNRQGYFDILVYPGVYKVWFYAGAVVIPIVSYTWEYYDNAASDESATLITVPPHTTIMNINAQLAPPGTIRGRVIDDAGQGVPQIQVTAYRDLTGNGDWQAVSTTVSDGGGYYGIPNVGGFGPLVYHIGIADTRTPPHYHPLIYPAAGYPKDGEDIAVDYDYEVWIADFRLMPYNSLNFPPLARPDMIPVLQPTADGAWVSFGSVLANDLDTEAMPLRAELIQAPSQGQLTLQESGSFTYTSPSEPWTSATFTYRAGDGVNTSDVVSATFFLTTDQGFLPLIRDGEVEENGQ